MPVVADSWVARAVARLVQASAGVTAGWPPVVMAASEVGQAGADALAVDAGLGHLAAEGRAQAEVPAAGLAAAGQLQGDALGPAGAVAGHGQGGPLVGGQGLDGGQAGPVGADVQLQLDRDPAVQPAAGQLAPVQGGPLGLGPVGPGEAVDVAGGGPARVAGRGQDGVDPAVGPGRLQGLHPLGLGAEQPGGDVEEVHAVLDRDAPAHLPVPEPVAGVEALVAGQVLQGELPGRAQHRLLEPADQGVQGVAAQRVVDCQPGRPGGPGLGQHLGGVLEPGGQRLLAEHVPAGAERGQGQAGVAGRRGGDGHHRDPLVGQQALGLARLDAVDRRQGVGPVPVPVGHGHRPQPRQVGRRLQDQRPEPAGAEQPQAQLGGRRARRPGRPVRPWGAGQLRGSAWRSFTGSSRPVGVT